MAMEYSSDTIEVNQNLSHVRKRPTGYIGSRGVEGQIHLIREWLDNATDEIVLKPNGGDIHVCLFRDRKRGRYQIGIFDNGRGIPSKSLRDVTTVLGASGKMSENSAYRSSSGLFGIGGKVAAALSSRFTVITKNYMEDVVSRIYLNDGVEVAFGMEKQEIPNGTLVVFEPDLKSFFTGGTDFMESGYLDLVAVCEQINVFNEDINFVFHVYDAPLPESFWKCGNQGDILSAYEVFLSSLNKKNQTIEYASANVPDKSSYLFKTWKITSGITFSDSFEKVPTDKSDRLAYKCKLFISRKSAYGSPQVFVTVNNVVLQDKTGNSPVSVFLNLFREKVMEKADSEKLKEFIRTEYRFPTLMLALGVFYDGAELSGMTKTSFKDEIFASQFASELKVIFESGKSDWWDSIWLSLKSDIEQKYAQAYDSLVSKTVEKKLFTILHFPNNYQECKESGQHSELLIVEGTSAGNIIGTRDNRFQAVYATRGKPTNGASKLESIVTDRKRLIKDPIYADLLTILNITPNTTDMTKARFGRIIIATDADADGYHIRALHLNNLYIINPKIIESGIVWVANPPLYSMEISKDKQLYLRDKVALTDALIELVYRKVFEFKIISRNLRLKPDNELYREVFHLVEYVGKEFETVSKQLNIPLLILERLVMAAEYIYPRINYDGLKQYFSSAEGCDVRLSSNELGGYIIISIDKEDYPIGMDSLGEAIMGHLYPLAKKFALNDVFYEVTSINRGGIYRDQKMTTAMLYIVMQQLKKAFKIKRYKGLGQLSNEGCAKTIMDPATRSLTQITGPGSPEANFALIGKNPDERKKLLTETNVLSGMFLKN